ncbi:MAG: phosphoribosylglycinamide formyltransferase [Thermoguttaceae bacterium]|nr:phosphoribosylglycinamide formyltransferase [Thermoguttaceae bacterium]
MKNLAVFVSGGGTNLQAIIDAVQDGRLTGVQIVAVISSSRKAYALERAANAGIPCFCFVPKEYENTETYTDALLEKLAELKVDLIALAGWLVVLDPRIVQAYQYRIVNVHPSLIPAFFGKGNYGIRIHENALSRGVKITGATTHLIDDGTDTGPIVIQKAIPVEDDDTPETLQKRVMEQCEHVILPETIQLMVEDRLIVEGHRVRIREK